MSHRREFLKTLLGAAAGAAVVAVVPKPVLAEVERLGTVREWIDDFPPPRWDLTFDRGRLTTVLRADVRDGAHWWITDATLGDTLLPHTARAHDIVHGTVKFGERPTPWEVCRVAGLPTDPRTVGRVRTHMAEVERALRDRVRHQRERDLRDGPPHALPHGASLSIHPLAERPLTRVGKDGLVWPSLRGVSQSADGRTVAHLVEPGAGA